MESPDTEKPVYVNCAKGANRSPAFLKRYKQHLMEKNGGIIPFVDKREQDIAREKAIELEARRAI